MRVLTKFRVLADHETMVMQSFEDTLSYYQSVGASPSDEQSEDSPSDDSSYSPLDVDSLRADRI